MARNSSLALLGAAAVMLAAGGDDVYQSLKRRLRSEVARDPLDALFGTVLVGGYLFWVAEREKNPRCQSLDQAVLYIATSLSVGYDNLFPETPAGHAIATLIHTIGPSMAASGMDPPAADKENPLRDVVDRLDAILRELQVQALATRPPQHPPT